MMEVESHGPKGTRMQKAEIHPCFFPSVGQYLRSSLAAFVALVVGGLALALLPLPVLLALTVGVTLVLLFLLRPVLGLWLLPFTVPFGAVVRLPVGGAAITATEGLIALTLVAWLAQGVARRQVRLALPPLTVPLLLLLGAMLLSIANARALAPAVAEFTKWVEILLVYVLTFNLVGQRSAVSRQPSAAGDQRSVGLSHGRKGTRTEEMAIFHSSVFLSIRGANSHETNWQPTAVWVLVGALLAAGALEALHGVAGAVLRSGPPQFAILGGRLYRAAGVFQQPNPFGGYMNHSLPIGVSLSFAWLLWLADHPQARTFRNAVLGAALVAATGVLGLGLLLSWSRGAWLGAVAGLGVVGLVWLWNLLGGTVNSRFDGERRVRRWTLGVIWTALTLGVAFVLFGGTRFLPAAPVERLVSGLRTFTTLDARGAVITDANFATLERIAHWQAALGMWRDRFWTGVGIGNYEAAYADYALAKWPYALGHAHNIYLNMAAEVGFIGLVAYLLFVAAAFGHTWRAVRGLRRDALMARGLLIGVLGVLVALAVHNLFDNLYVHAMGVHLALLLGVVPVLAGQVGDAERA